MTNIVFGQRPNW